MDVGKTIVVTGATGFIGSNLLAGLEAAGYGHIVCIDSFGTGQKWRNVAARSLVQFVLPQQGFAWLRRHADELGAIVHLGAVSSTTETDVDLIVQTNVQLTMRLYSFCQKHQLPFIYASSAATYGAGEHGYDDRDDVEYLSQLRPLNAYGWSKNTVDKLIFSTHLHHQVVGLKFFNVYGPNEYHKGEQASTAWHFYNQLVQQGEARLFRSYLSECADGEQKRDFVYVADCVKVILWMLDHPGVSGLFNVGSGTPRSFNDMARLVAEHAAAACKIRYIDMPPILRPRYQYFTQANITKLRRAGYSAAMTTLDEGVALYVRHFLRETNQYI